MAPSLCLQFRPRRDQLTSSSASIAPSSYRQRMAESKRHVLERTDCSGVPPPVGRKNRKAASTSWFSTRARTINGVDDHSKSTTTGR